MLFAAVSYRGILIDMQTEALMWNQRLSALAFCLIVLYNESIRIAVQQHWMPAEKRSHIHALLLRKRNAEVNEMLAFGTDNEEVTAKCPVSPFHDRSS